MTAQEQLKLFAYLAHGDEKHREWLKLAILNYFAGLPRPEEGK